MDRLNTLISLCKRRGFVFPSSEIYGGFAGVYDYGHYGILLKNNIQRAWWKAMVQLRDDVVGLDSAIFMHPKTWVASGHVGGFNDPQVDCRKCKNRMRADHVLEDFGINADKASIAFINGELDKLRLEKKLKCQNCGSMDLTTAKVFSLMAKSNLGSPTEEMTDQTVSYLRPETCGGIYLQYQNTRDALHLKLPFGIAQVGKAFRNEIVARQFIFRTREFEQMEMQYFLHPRDMKEKYEEWKEVRWQWYLSLGIPEGEIRWNKHEKLAHYAAEAFDIEFDFPSLGGFKEVEGLHTRGNWDLSQHGKYSGVNLSDVDEQTKESFIPNILETSVGLNRLFLMFLDHAYCEEEIGGETRTLLKFEPSLAPVQVAVFPLLKNKPVLVEKARSVFDLLRSQYMCEFDDHDNIGKRYRRQDEIGTPYCITIDFETLDDDTVTIRDRDTTQQERIAVRELSGVIENKLNA
jgi:glycyl-tRNA synthetase